eukprot:PITA_01952
MPPVHPRVSSQQEVSVSTGDHHKFCAPHCSSPSPTFSPATVTVWKRSLIFNVIGFTIFDSLGNLVFRVNNYSSHAKRLLFLMDAVGNVLLTIRHKRLSFNDRWEAFRGDCYGCGIKPAFRVTQSVSTLFSSKSSAKVVLNPTKRRNMNLCDYEIEGSRCKPSSSFTVFGASQKIIAQVTRKQATSGIILGNDVLSLVVQPGMDQTFMMELLIIFIRITSR